MNINRNNYEEYFLLYTDKELTAAEKNMVELFVQQNPDLEEEFIMLRQAVAKPDTDIIIQNKSSLFKNDGVISPINYEEKFLLYADNELTLSEIQETEKFALSNSSLQNEFTLLQQVKYEADTSIVFPDKRSLYKKEEDNKIIPFLWKAIAAAVLLGVGLWTGISYLPVRPGHPGGQKNMPVELVTNDKSVQPKKQDAVHSPVEPTKKSQNLSANINNKSEKNSAKKQSVSHDNSIEKKPVQENVPVKNIDEKKNPVQKNEAVAINNLPNKIESLTNINNAEKPVTTTTSQADINLTNTPQNYNLQNAFYINDAAQKSENYVFYNITTEEFNKSKIGTFLKRVKRGIERKNPLKNNSSND